MIFTYKLIIFYIYYQNLYNFGGLFWRGLFWREGIFLAGYFDANRVAGYFDAGYFDALPILTYLTVNHSSQGSFSHNLARRRSTRPGPILPGPFFIFHNTSLEISNAPELVDYNKSQ